MPRGAGCDDGTGATYCIVGYRWQGPSCTYDSDCSSLTPNGDSIPLCMRYANGASFCGENGRYADGSGPQPGDLYCIANTASATRDLEWEEVVRVKRDGHVMVK